MGKKRGILLAVLFVALLGGLVWMLSRPTEPAYQGKPLSAWLYEFNGLAGATNQAALVAFREMGSNAVPMLLKIIEADDSPFQGMMSELNRIQSLVHFPPGVTLHQRWGAAWALYAMGANAKPAFPAITNQLFQSNTLFFSGVPLAGMGSDGLPPLFAALTNQNASIRYSAATALAWERSDPNLVVPALIARLSDQSWVVRCTAAQALGQLHAEPELAVPALMREFPDNHPVLRGLILISIGQFGTNASVAVPMLLDALSDKDEKGRTIAASAL